MVSDVKKKSLQLTLTPNVPVTYLNSGGKIGDTLRAVGEQPNVLYSSKC